MAAVLAGCGESGPPGYASTARLLLDGVGGISAQALEDEVKFLRSGELRQAVDARMQASHPGFATADVKLTIEDSIKTASILLEAIGKNPATVEAFLKILLEEYLTMRESKAGREQAPRNPVRVLENVSEPKPR